MNNMTLMSPALYSCVTHKENYNYEQCQGFCNIIPLIKKLKKAIRESNALTLLTEIMLTHNMVKIIVGTDTSLILNVQLNGM
jgi:hypothetical protein